MYKYLDFINDEEALHPEFGYSEHLLKLAYDKFPYRMEDSFKMYERGLQLRRFLKHYFSTRPTKSDDEKIVIVTHSAFLCSLTAKGYDYEKKELIEPQQMHNCQFISW